MTSDLETFRQGARAFRNAADWAKEQRDTAINLANECCVKKKEKEKTKENTPLGPSTCSDPMSSFNSATSGDTCTVPAMSQCSQTSLNADSRGTTHLHESESSMDELALDFKSQSKSSRKRLKRPRREDKLDKERSSNLEHAYTLQN